jgi:alcohol dehydrogenase, propanol-preferring
LFLFPVLEGAFGRPLPQTASHEGSGTIVALGDLAKERGFKEGMRVMCGIPLHPCGSCFDCANPNGDSQYCINLEGHIGVQTHGCFADYVRADSRSSTPLPDEVTFLSAAPLACAGRTVWRSVLQTELKKGETVCIVGSGGGLG